MRSCDCSGQGQSRGYQATLTKESVKKKPKLEAEDQSDTIRESNDKRIFHKAKGFEQVGGSVAGHSGRTEDARGRGRGKAAIGGLLGGMGGVSVGIAGGNIIEQERRRRNAEENLTEGGNAEMYLG